jgi:hypothetical protein
METYSNLKLATTRHTMGALRADARAAGARAERLSPLLLMLTLLMSGCLVVPIPANRPDPAVRTNVTPETVNHLGTGGVSRTGVLLQLGEPDEVSLEERQFRYHTERIKWDVYWLAGGGYSADGGVIEIKRYYDLVLRFNDLGKIAEGSWLEGWLPGKLRQKAHWAPTNAPPNNPSAAVVSGSDK